MFYVFVYIGNCEYICLVKDWEGGVEFIFL